VQLARAQFLFLFLGLDFVGIGILRIFFFEKCCFEKFLFCRVKKTVDSKACKFYARIRVRGTPEKIDIA
jgi:hypothetical protein